ncbi:MAG: BamA/TamA family outer membrane protein [Saprospiraceae bacterium]|nr:BamA/TamA family outer membrane protein [Saprospiraceae bacterium]MCF8248866.1 BamA/TamA family outer membrane protein [Saprospiraceae bacterium]MCF8279591.1 BamA/TamA family outer membrane protein [Bacteroidales bacterium]MCF8310151.1 BamA/TamA family outer membrane protein [Saprospiraceae bacterium]MCF8439051.1 BamA/TamA family outer membrane protein [Saprospiraceae bacterium]
MKFTKYYIIFILFVVALCSCNTTQFLDKSKGQQYLHKNILKIDESKGKVKSKSNMGSELSKLYVKKENRKMFGIPRQYFYFVSQDTFNRSKIGMAAARWKAKRGEEPVYFDSASVRETELIMESYLQSRGYFFADVNYQVDFNKPKTKATVTYIVHPDGRFTIDSLDFQCKDTAVLHILNEIAPSSLLKVGSPVDVKLYDQEVARITKYLRDNGYAYFYPQYISTLEGFDSSNVMRTVSIRLKVLTPPKQERHVKYYVGNIYVFPDYDPTSNLIRPDTLVDGLFFGTNGRKLRVKSRTLASSIFIRTGEVYNQEALDNSIRQLGALGVFRPPTLRIQEDTLHPGNLNMFIFLTANKKWEIGWEGGLSTTERPALGNKNLIGVSFNPSLRNRNFFRGAELLVANLNFGAEFNFFNGKDELVNSLDFRWQNDLYFPRFADYLGIWSRLQKWKITGPEFNKNLWQKATSRASAGYNLLDLRRNYSLQFANLSYGYDVPVSINHRVSINHFGIDLVLPKIEAGSIFEMLLDSNPALRTSFDKQFITGLLFRDINFTYTSPPKSTGGSWYFRGYFDISGVEVMTANAIYGAISGSKTSFNVNGVDFSHYAKLELDGRHYWQFNTNRSLIARLNMGMAVPYYKSESIPYVKQFYVGGPYGIRGWYTRELGPGLYKDPTTDNASNRNLFYQAGDMKLEYNLEYRFLVIRPFGLFSIFGAVFVDGGNIWTKDYDESRKGSQFSVTRKLNEEGEITDDLFLREMGLSTGFGVRFDFNYFVFRLDFGTPIRNNYPDPARGNTYFIDPKLWEINKFKDVFGKFNDNIRYQLAIGYPF